MYEQEKKRNSFSLFNWPGLIGAFVGALHWGTLQGVLAGYVIGLGSILGLILVLALLCFGFVEGRDALRSRAKLKEAKLRSLKEAEEHLPPDSAFEDWDQRFYSKRAEQCKVAIQKSYDWKQPLLRVQPQSLAEPHPYVPALWAEANADKMVEELKSDLAVVKQANLEMQQELDLLELAQSQAFNRT
jgi:hypothetical protein